MSETHDTEQWLVRIFEMLRMHQEAVFKANLSIAAAVETLKESDTAFGEAYDRHFWELKQGRMGDDNATAVRIIDQLKRELRPPQATSSAGAGD